MNYYISNTETEDHFITDDISNAMGTIICPGCQQDIDPTVCWCGDPTNEHSQSSNHAVVPMGCCCHMRTYVVEAKARETFPETDWDLF